MNNSGVLISKDSYKAYLDCSNYKRVTEVAQALKLKISEQLDYSNNKEKLIEHLKTGNPALVLFSE